MTDIFQSPGDRLRFEILLKSLTEGSINLAVLSQHDLVLDFYGNLFEERLRAAGEQNIEFCTSTSSEQLVQTFNDILSELTLNQATEKEKKLAPRRFLVFRDSILMQEFELQLLARLVNGFPAGNISVILLINSAGNYRKKLEAFGKNLLQWEVETKAGEPKRVLSDWVADTPDPVPASEPPVLQPMSAEDSEDAVKQLNMPKKTSWRIPGLGKKPQPQPAPASSVAATPAPAPASTPIKPPEAAPVAAFDAQTPREPVLGAPVLGVPASPAAASAVQAADTDVFKRGASKPRWGIVLFVLLMSLAVFGFMYKDMLVEEAELFKKYLLRGTPAAPAPAPEPVASAPEPAASSAAPAASDVASSAVVDMQATPASGSMVAAPVASEPLVAAPTKEVINKEKQAKETISKETISKEAKTNAAQADKVSDADWVSQLPDDGFVLQLAAFDVEDEIQAFKRSHAAYASARVMQVRKKDTNKRYFILLAGPFETKPEADRFMKSNPLLAKGWLRSVKSVKAQLTKG